MSVEDYYYSKMDSETIESNIYGAVVWNRLLELTPEEKATARQNIGAGTEDTNFVIKGFYDTFEEMILSLLTTPEPGDAYGIKRNVVQEESSKGSESSEGSEESEESEVPVPQPLYDIYVFNGATGQWVNNGPLSTGAELIDDNSNDHLHVLSSQKTKELIQAASNALTVGHERMLANAIHAENILDGSVSDVYTATIGQNWTGGSPYVQTITVDGLLASDTPVIDIVPDNNYSTALSQTYAWAEIYKMVVSDNTLTVYAIHTTSVDIPIKILCVRK